MKGVKWFKAILIIFLVLFITGSVWAEGNYVNKKEIRIKGKVYKIVKCYKFESIDENLQLERYVDIIWKFLESDPDFKRDVEIFEIDKRLVLLFLADINNDGVKDIFNVLYRPGYTCSGDALGYGGSCGFSVLLSSKHGYKEEVGSLVQVFIHHDSPICILDSKTNGINDLLLNGKIIVKAKRVYSRRLYYVPIGK
jgi:hypothetical protein